MFSCIELFSGCGGMALGFENADFYHTMINDCNKDCVQTMLINRPNWPVVLGKIQELSFDGMHADVVCGGIPCQPFSQIGLRLGHNDDRGRLFIEFFRCVKKVNPKVVVIENVKGILNRSNKKTVEDIVKSFDDNGYNVKHKVLDAQYFMVPQSRKRVFFIGTRKDISSEFVFPSPDQIHKPTLGDALNGVVSKNGTKYSERIRKIMALVPEGGNWKSLPKDMQREVFGENLYKKIGNQSYSGVARRLSRNKPSPTILCAVDQKLTSRCHPTEDRPLSCEECASIQTFPRSWVFFGGKSSIYRQIGNAVPVNLAYFLALSVRSFLLNSLKNNPV